MRWKMLVVLAVSLLLAAEPAKKDAAEQETGQVCRHLEGHVD